MVPSASDAPLIRNATGVAQDRADLPAPSTELPDIIGANVRRLRTQLGLSVSELAAKISLSKAMLSKIENAQASCSLATLGMLADGLDVSVTSLFRGIDSAREAAFTPSGSGAFINRHGTKYQHAYQQLGALGGQHRRLESLLVTMTEPSDGFPAFQHPGTEFIYMLEGSMRYAHGQQSYLLTPGDALQFDGEAAHGPTELLSFPIRFLSVIAFPEHSFQ